jgi:hypothetical protein
MVYAAFLVAHSTIRWLVLLFGLAVVGRGIAAWSGRPWTDADARTAKLYLNTLNLQFLIGLILYVFLSPAIREALQDVGGAMRDGRLRFFLVEHLIGMFIGVALAHIGSARIKKAPTDARKHRTAAIFFGLSLLVIALSIPWPGTAAARPLITWPF